MPFLWMFPVLLPLTVLLSLPLVLPPPPSLLQVLLGQWLDSDLLPPLPL